MITRILALMSIFLLIGLTGCTKREAQKKSAPVAVVTKILEIPVAPPYRKDSVEKFVDLYNEWGRLEDVTESLIGKTNGGFWESPFGEALSEEIGAYREVSWYYRAVLNDTEKDSLVLNEFSRFPSRKRFEEYLFDPLIYAGLP